MKTMIATTAALMVSALAVSAAELDADADGMVTIEEMQAVHPETTQDGFAALDTDQDGALNAAELAAAVEAGILPANG